MKQKPFSKLRNILHTIFLFDDNDFTNSLDNAKTFKPDQLHHQIKICNNDQNNINKNTTQKKKKINKKKGKKNLEMRKWN